MESVVSFCFTLSTCFSILPLIFFSIFSFYTKKSSLHYDNRLNVPDLGHFSIYFYAEPINYGHEKRHWAVLWSVLYTASEFTLIIDHLQPIFTWPQNYCKVQMDKNKRDIMNFDELSDQKCKSGHNHQRNLMFRWKITKQWPNRLSSAKKIFKIRTWLSTENRWKSEKFENSVEKSPETTRNTAIARI